MNRRPPNILFLLSDQHRPDAMGCAGHPLVRTPHMDRLAAEGVHYRGCYCSTPLCMPQRVSLATGRFAHNTGVYTNSVGSLPASTPMISRALHEAGYHTAFIGKLHLRQDGEPGEPRCDQWLADAGYDHAIPYPGKAWAMKMGQPHVYRQHLQEHGLEEALTQDYQERAFSGRPGLFGGHPASLPEEHYMDTRISEDAVDFLERAPDDQPFFCWVNWGGPHDPWDAPGRFGEMYDPAEMDPPVEDPLTDAPQAMRDWQAKYIGRRPDADWRGVKAQYYGMISLIDEHIGRMLQVLARRGMLDNTLIVYSSDHGEMLFDHGMVTKWVMYEPSAGVPLIVRWPAEADRADDAAAGGRVVDAPVSLLDVIPTFLNIAGAAPQAMPVLHGQPLPRSPEAADADRPVFCEMDQTKMVRHGPWKLVHNPEWEVDQLFHLTDDPRELTNLATRPDHTGRVQTMRSTLLDWMITTQTRPA